MSFFVAHDDRDSRVVSNMHEQLTHLRHLSEDSLYKRDSVFGPDFPDIPGDPDISAVLMRRSEIERNGLICLGRPTDAIPEPVQVFSIYAMIFTVFHHIAVFVRSTS